MIFRLKIKILIRPFFAQTSWQCWPGGRLRHWVGGWPGGRLRHWVGGWPGGRLRHWVGGWPGGRLGLFFGLGIFKELIWNISDDFWHHTLSGLLGPYQFLALKSVK